MWRVILPLVGIALAVAVPLARHAQKVRAEHTAAEFLAHVRAAQQRFREEHQSAGYASALASLTTACPGSGGAAMGQPTATLIDAGYHVRLRPADGAVTVGDDCHGRPLASDYYVAAEPISAETPAQQAFAVTAAGRVFVFFDGIAPRERDMAAGGLATPLDRLDVFTIP